MRRHTNNFEEAASTVGLLIVLAFIAVLMYGFLSVIQIEPSIFFSHH